MPNSYYSRLFARAAELIHAHPNWTADECHAQAVRDLDGPRLPHIDTVPQEPQEQFQLTIQ